MCLALSGCGEQAQGQVAAATAPQQEVSDNASVTVAPVQVIPPNDAPEKPADTPQMIERVDISFDYARQSTMASNQLAVWIEDADGQMVKTLLVTNFTAVRRGYRSRDMSLTEWVKTADPESMGDAEIDAISAATPSTGRLVYSWDMTDANGERVPDGIYTIRVEGTLFWESSVLYLAELDTANAMGGELSVMMVRSEPDNTDNEAMIGNVRISVTIRE